MNVLSMGWEHVLFAHRDVEPPVVDEKLPDGVVADTYDGRAWLGVVSFVMRDIRPRFFPRGLTFGELNLRTYVRPEDGSGEDGGIYFFNLDANDRVGVAVARRLFELPYYRASMSVDVEGGDDGARVNFRSSRRHEGVPSANFDGEYAPTGDAFYAESGSLEEFLTERYSFYVADSSGTLYRGDVEHEPWKLRNAEAEIRTNTLFEANGFESPDDEPHLLYSEGVEVLAEPLERVRMSGV